MASSSKTAEIETSEPAIRIASGSFLAVFVAENLISRCCTCPWRLLWFECCQPHGFFDCCLCLRFRLNHGLLSHLSDTFALLGLMRQDSDNLSVAIRTFDSIELIAMQLLSVPDYMLQKSYFCLELKPVAATIELVGTDLWLQNNFCLYNYWHCFYYLPIGALSNLAWSLDLHFVATGLLLSF